MHVETKRLILQVMTSLLLVLASLLFGFGTAAYCQLQVVQCQLMNQTASETWDSNQYYIKEWVDFTLKDRVYTNIQVCQPLEVDSTHWITVCDPRIVDRSRLNTTLNQHYIGNTYDCEINTNSPHCVWWNSGQSWPKNMMISGVVFLCLFFCSACILRIFNVRVWRAEMGLK
jgi:hypothetical protein